MTTVPEIRRALEALATTGVKYEVYFGDNIPELREPIMIVHSEYEAFSDALSTFARENPDVITYADKNPEKPIGVLKATVVKAMP